MKNDNIIYAQEIKWDIDRGKFKTKTKPLEKWIFNIENDFNQEKKKIENGHNQKKKKKENKNDLNQGKKNKITESRMEGIKKITEKY